MQVFPSFVPSSSRSLLSFLFQWDIVKNKLQLIATSKLVMLTSGDWKSLSDLRNVYTEKIFNMPKVSVTSCQIPLVWTRTLTSAATASITPLSEQNFTCITGPKTVEEGLPLQRLQSFTGSRIPVRFRTNGLTYDFFFLLYRLDFAVCTSLSIQMESHLKSHHRIEELNSPRIWKRTPGQEAATVIIDRNGVRKKKKTFTAVFRSVGGPLCLKKKKNWRLKVATTRPKALPFWPVCDVMNATVTCDSLAR